MNNEYNNQGYDNQGQIPNGMNMNGGNSQPLGDMQGGQQFNNQQMNNSNQMFQQPMMNQPMNNSNQMFQQPMMNQPMNNNNQMYQQPMMNQPMNNNNQMYQQPMMNQPQKKKSSMVGIIVGAVVAFIVGFLVFKGIRSSNMLKGTWNCDLDGQNFIVTFDDSKNITLSASNEKIKGTYEKSSYTPAKEYRKSGYTYKVVKIQSKEFVSSSGVSTPYSTKLEIAIGSNGKEGQIITRDVSGVMHTGACKR